MSGKRFEEHIRKKVSQAEMPPRPEIWDQIAQKLEEDEKPFFILFPLWKDRTLLFLSAAIIILLLGLGYLIGPYSPFFHSQKSFPSNGHQKISSKPSHIQDSLFSQDSSTLSSHAVVSDSLKASVVPSISDREQISLSENTAEHVHISNSSYPNIDTIRKKQLSPPISNDFSAQEQKVGPSLTLVPIQKFPHSIYPNVTEAPLNILPISPSRYLSKWSLQLESAYFLSLDDIALGVVTDQLFESFDDQVVSQTPPELAPLDSVWRITTPNSGMSIRFAARYYFSTSWFIESGIYYSQSTEGEILRIQRTLFDQGSQMNIPIQDRTGSQLAFRYRRVAFPLWISKEISSQKWSLALSGGGRLALHTQQDIGDTVDPARLTFAGFAPSASFETQRRWSWSMSSRILLSRRLSPSFSLYTGPEFSYLFTDFSSTDELLFGPNRFQLGWSLGVGWRPFRR